jgi:hypothetical protein
MNICLECQKYTNGNCGQHTQQLYGWICPQCKRVWAWWKDKCDSCADYALQQGIKTTTGINPHTQSL